MILNGIKFPKEILEAINNNTLVIFAGAGTSVDAPTSLPNFNDLAKRIAEGTGETIAEGESCEVFLGHLKSKGVDVNQQAARLLSDHCLQHNKMHEAIIDLFPVSSEIKVVTTNYDQMFEQVLEKKNIKTPVFNAPALPLGGDVYGIIHVHGNIDTPKYMVVTDEDFGRAYLTEGYAARFLVELFQSYTILFIGYSYNDTILRYLTRAMARNVGPRKFILTNNVSADWNALGIEPIIFPEKGFSILREGIEELGQRAKRSLSEWKNQFEVMVNCPLQDFTLETEIDDFLLNLEKIRIFADCIEGVEWLEKLDKKSVFDALFDSKGELSDFDLVWMNWLIKKIIGKYDVGFEKLFLQKENRIHPNFAHALLWEISVNKKISDEYLNKYIILLDENINTSLEIFHLIKVCAEREMFNICQHLFAKFFDVSFVLEKTYCKILDSCTYKHQLKGEPYHIQRAWNQCKEKFLTDCPERWIELAKNVICELHDKYIMLGLDSKGEDPLSMVMLVIEDRVDYSGENSLRLLCDIFVSSCKACENKSVAFVKGFIRLCLNERSALLKNLALKALRGLETISANDKYDIFINNIGIYFMGGKEQIFLLTKTIFNDLSEDRKNQLIDLIYVYDVFDGERHNEYAKYNWCVWIKRFCPDNDRINALEMEILSRNDFAPREHPELDIEFGSAVWVQDKSPVTKEKMMSLTLEEIEEYLGEYNEDSFEGTSRFGVLMVFSECCQSSYKWAFDVARYLVEKQITKDDIWYYLILGVQDGDASIDEQISLLKMLTENVLVVCDVLSLAKFLLYILKKDGIKEKISKYQVFLLEIADVLWKNRGTCDLKMKRLIDDSTNTAIGIVLISYIYMLLYIENAIPDRFKMIFENSINLEGYENRIAICVLAGHFNFLCLRDYDWCINQLLPLLESNEREKFSAAWEGIAFFSRKLNKDIADVIAPIYFKAVEHIGWLSEETRKAFIDIYLLLLIYVINDPCQQYIPKFYRYADESCRKEFLNLIEHRLSNSDGDFKLNWWNSWLKQYIINRFQNKPTALLDSEYTIIMNWILELTDIFEEIIGIICENKTPRQVDTLFIYRLQEKKIVDVYPHEVIRLLTVLLNGGTDFQYYTGEVLEIFKNAHGLKEKEIKDFHEACLKRNIKS